MSSLTTHTTRTSQVGDLVRAWPTRVAAATLAVAVSFIHVKDQGGLTALRDPAYLGQGYRLLEIAGVLVALGMFVLPSIPTWVLAGGVALGPLVGFTLTRTVGLPNATDDIGNWGEALGVAAVSVEVALLAIALGVLVPWATSRRR
ncbi:MAG TPA: hypothetical protein VNC22_12955 [Sporichthya sp.]|jgi:hypothetical protein|nr:hypothetical protein [Sporichthya sp.]